MMDRVQRTNDSKCDTASSESYRLYFNLTHMTENIHVKSDSKTYTQTGSIAQITNFRVQLTYSTLISYVWVSVQPSPPANQSYTQYDLVWMPSTLDALLDTSTRLMSITRGCFYSF